MPTEAIETREEHDAAIKRAEDGTLVIILIYTDSNPACKPAMPKIESMSENYPYASFYKMELNSETSAMWKLSVQNTPSFLLMKGTWAQTIVGPNLRMLEDLIKGRS